MAGDDSLPPHLRIKQVREGRIEEGGSQLHARGQLAKEGEEALHVLCKGLQLLWRRLQQCVAALHHLGDLGVLEHERLSARVVVLGGEDGVVSDKPVEPVLLWVQREVVPHKGLCSLFPAALLGDEAHEGKVRAVLVEVAATHGGALLQREEDLAALVQGKRVANLADVKEEAVELVLLRLRHVGRPLLAVLRLPCLGVRRLFVEEVNRLAVLGVGEANEEGLLSHQGHRTAVEVVGERKEAVLAVNHLRAVAGLCALVVGLELVEKDARDEARGHHAADEVAHVLGTPLDLALVDGVELHAVTQGLKQVINGLRLAVCLAGKERCKDAGHLVCGLACWGLGGPFYWCKRLFQFLFSLKTHGL